MLAVYRKCCEAPLVFVELRFASVSKFDLFSDTGEAELRITCDITQT